MGETGAIAGPLHGPPRARADGMPLVLQAVVNAAAVALLVLAVVDTAVYAQGPAPATLTYANRPIIELRAEVIGRRPADRAAAAVRVLDRVVASGATPTVTTRAIEGGILLVAGDENVLMLAPADVDALSGETLESAARSASARLQVALAETAELHAPGRIARAALASLAITAVLAGLLWLLRRLDRLFVRRFADFTERRLARAHAGVALVASQLVDLGYRAARLLMAAAALILVYLWLANILRRFPYTRPWGESLRALLVTQLSAFGATLAHAAPGLFAVLLIIVAARWASKAVALLFDSVERGRLTLPGIYPDTAPPTRRLIVAGVWMSALAMAYPYEPDSDTDGVKGISVFIGVVLSFGSTGVIQHLLAGLMLTYARAAHVGDFARIGDVEGTIMQIGPLATKMRTPFGEEVTIPNAVVVSQTLTNYTTNGGSAAYLPTSVTIGYDTPWRQVEALLLAAAHRTTGLRDAPPATVWRVSLDDYYVKYTLLVAPEDPRHRAEVRDRLHGHILDAFNEHGVQIMSPHYMADPAGAKVVPPSQWYAPPAAPVPAPASKLSVHW